MVRLAWNEFLQYSEPKAVIEAEFCREGANYMKQITNFVMWVEKNTGFDGNNNGVRWTLRKMSDGYDINIQFSCLTTYHLKKINNKFRSLCTKLYHGK